MSDNFFDNKDNNMDNQDPQTIKVGEKEYTPEQLQALVSLGEIGQEMETKWNTKIDKVYPEFSKAKNDLKALEEENTRLKTPQQPTPPSVGEEMGLSEEDLAKARKEARKIGIVTEDAFDEFLGNKFREYFVRERAIEKTMENLDRLESEISGEDGRPKFVKEDILRYMQETGVGNPESAYKLMHEKDLEAWRVKTLNEAKREGVYSEPASSAGGKTPPTVKPTRDNLSSLVAEALTGPR